MMKRILNLVMVTSGLLAASTALFGPVVHAGPNVCHIPKVDVCHIPPDNPDNFHTKSVSENAVPSHLGHGDFLGACTTQAETLCDDQNF